MLVFMLAVMLPAAALVFASVFYLRHVQRNKMIDGDLSHCRKENEQPDP
jgi:hypothetical protein